MRISMRRELVDEGPSGVAETQQLRHLVEGFSGSIVASVADVFVAPAGPVLLRKI